MREILIFSTKGNRRSTITTDVATWNELKKVLSENSIEYAGLKAIVASTQNTLESNDAVLPEGNFTLMMIPVKVKLGVDYSSMSYNELRKLATELDITKELNMPPTKAELVRVVTEYYTPVYVELTLEDRVTILENKVKELSSLLSDNEEEVDEEVFKQEIEEVDEELNELIRLSQEIENNIPLPETVYNDEDEDEDY